MIRMHIDESFVMDTAVEQRVFGENAVTACESANRLLRRLENRMSFFRQGSDVRALNEASGSGMPVLVGADTIRVLAAAKEYADKSGGAFDVTAAPLSECWRGAARRGDGIPPGEDELTRARSLVGSGGLFVSHEAGTAMLEKKGAAVDLGGIAKGYAADCAIEIIMSMGVEAALINIGGNVKTLGKKPDGQPWVVGLQDPDKARGVFLGALRVAAASVVTSGGYERFSVIGTRKYHHIIDPATGRPASSGLLSATVIASSSMLADGLSTAAFVLGLERTAGLLADYPNAEAVLIDKNRHIWLTDGARDAWSPAPGYERLRISNLSIGKS